MLNEANIEQLVDLVVADIQFLKLFEGLDTLYFLEFAATQVKHTNILKRSTDITERWDDRVIQLEVLETRQNFTSYL